MLKGLRREPTPEELDFAIGGAYEYGPDRIVVDYHRFVDYLWMQGVVTDTAMEDSHVWGPIAFKYVPRAKARLSSFHKLIDMGLNETQTMNLLDRKE